MINAGERMPCFVDFTAASNHDRSFLDRIYLPEGSYLAMDKSYIDYKKVRKLTDQNICLVARLKLNADYSPSGILKKFRLKYF